MKKPVRYYIVKADDQPVVRSVPVAPVRQEDPAAPTTAPAGAFASPRPRGRRRVTRLVRAAIGRQSETR